MATITTNDFSNKEINKFTKNAIRVLEQNDSNLNTGIASAITECKTYADGLVQGLYDDRGNYDASGNTFPSTGGSGSAGAILKGDIWTISVAGTLGSVNVSVGDTVRATTDAPASAADWAINTTGTGYTAENVANKSSTVDTNTTKYPTNNAVKTYADAKVEDSITDGILDKAPSQNAVYDALSNKQPLNAALTSISGLSPSNDDFLQRKSGAWTNRTVAQVKTDLAIDNVNNTSDATKKEAYTKRYRVPTSSSATLTKGNVGLEGACIKMTASGQTMSLPAVISTDDGFVAIVINDAGSSYSFNVASSDGYNIDGGATVTLLAGEYLKCMYDHSTTSWRAIL